ncbi:MAG TPA: STAS/SEC14 domain-containing protein [Mycobacterium sp.]|nr:STAS/SEC14 domain-containing protein [Mycobacterium sp.]
MPVGVQAMEATGTLTADDYKQVFAPLVDEARQSGKRLRLLYQFGPGFNRITVGALWADTRLGAGYSRLLDGCAVVSDIDWIREPARGIGAWMPCPVRIFHNDDRDDAIAWLRSLPPKGTAASPRDMARAYLGGSVAAVGSLGALIFSRAVKSHDGAG